MTVTEIILLLMKVFFVFVGLPYLMLVCFRLAAYGFYTGKNQAMNEVKKEKKYNGNSNGKKEIA